MSTYYYMVCDDHEERTDAVSRTAGGWCFLGDGEETLLPFIIAHCGCVVRIIGETEYHDDDRIKAFREWKSENVQEDISKACDDGRWIRTSWRPVRQMRG